MLMLIVVTFIFIMLFVIDIVPACKDKQWKVFWAYSVMMLFAYVLIFLISIGINIPSPLNPIKNWLLKFVD